MANTFSALYYHFIFSTKNRIPFIKPQYEHRIWEYIGGIAGENTAVFRCVRPHRPNFFNTKVQGLKGSKIENNRWIAFLWTFDPLNLCVEKSLAYKSHAVEKRYKLVALQVGGVEDHIHAIISASPSVPSSKIAQLMKGGSSFWIRREFAELRNFEWQDGYGVFTVSSSVLPNVERYIQKQRDHHRKISFQEEYVAFLEKYGVKYDERYLWG
jgi:REP element-mobilizing transposase RayT